MDCTALATSSCGPTLVLGVHEIATYAWFSMLKKPDFNLVPGFYDPTSWSGLQLHQMDHAVGATHKWFHLLNKWGCHWQSFYVLLVEAYRTSKYQPNQNSQTISIMTKWEKNEQEIFPLKPYCTKEIGFQFGLRYHHKSLLHALCANFSQHTKPSKQSSLSVLFALFIFIYFYLLFIY